MMPTITGQGPVADDAEMPADVERVTDVVEQAIDRQCERGERKERHRQMLTAQSAANAAARQARRRQRL